MAQAAVLGFPRIGPQRELKKALESYWKGECSGDDMLTVAKAIREQNWRLMQSSGIASIPSNDFSLYDQVLDHILMFGAIPSRYSNIDKNDTLKLYFAMARGLQGQGVDVVAMEMTKWFDTNYHYIVPEFHAGQKFELLYNKAKMHYAEAKAMGIQTRPVIIGPVSFLLLGKARDGADVLSLLPNLLPAYAELLKSLKEAGAEWVQIDEPFLAMDITDAQKKAYKDAYAEIAKAASGLKIMLATYFAGLRDNTELACSLPVQGLHIDLVREPQQLADVLAKIGSDKLLSVGVVNGRNIWKSDYAAALKLAKEAADKLGKDRIQVASSCSLLHSPVCLSAEVKMDAEIKQWMAFATQKLGEIATITKALNEGEASVKAEWDENQKAIAARGTSKRIHKDDVKKRVAAITEAMCNRASEFSKRIVAQQNHFKLPLLPTTTIGSFPQTAEIREARANHKAGKMSDKDYDAFLEQKTIECVKYQDATDIDVPVHGEFERNDMVEYFGEQLDGYVFSQNGWVQSYGSRCVKPPIIFGDVSRPKPMTVRWSKFAQTLTKRPMKGMLTGPVTILQWSFVRDDQPRETTCKQIALAIRDEVVDLETAGIGLIQIDEPAIREGLPLRKADHKAYLKWAVDSFRLSAAGVKDETQIHTHMCYSEFNDIMDSIGAMDADVISIETSRSAMELLDAFVDYNYPNHIGPGVYDIHSPRVPKQEEMETLLRKALEVLQPEQIWVNPDCGLKTRGWKETEPALKAMVAAAKTIRKEIEQGLQKRKATA